MPFGDLPPGGAWVASRWITPASGGARAARAVRMRRGFLAWNAGDAERPRPGVGRWILHLRVTDFGWRFCMVRRFLKWPWPWLLTLTLIFFLNVLLLLGEANTLVVEFFKSVHKQRFYRVCSILTSQGQTVWPRKNGCYFRNQRSKSNLYADFERNHYSNLNTNIFRLSDLDLDLWPWPWFFF